MMNSNSGEKIPLPDDLKNLYQALSLELFKIVLPPLLICEKRWI